MKNSDFISKLISSVIITVILIYFMIKTTDMRIVFIPFLICSISMTLKNVGLIFEKESMIAFFDKLFKIGFFLFWFGFLVAADYICIRDKKYDLFIFSLLFWFAGIYFIKKKLFDKGENNQPKLNFNVAKFAGIALVIVTLLAGIALIVLGAVRAETAVIFAGLFFVFVPIVFIIFYLTTM